MARLGPGARKALEEIAAHGLAFGTAVFAAGKLLATMFVLPNWVWDTPVRELGGVFITWAYFGYSMPYGRAIALAQLGAAALVLAPRTRLLGLLVLVTILLNIVAIDLAYDVRPGLYVAVALLALTLALLATARARVGAAWRAIVAPPSPSPSRVALRCAVGVVALAAGFAVLVPTALTNRATRTALDGVWQVRQASGAAPAWDTFYVELAPICAVRTGRELSFCRYALERDGGTLRVDDGSRRLIATYVIAGETLALDGTLDGRPFTAELTRGPVPPGGRP